MIRRGFLFAPLLPLCVLAAAQFGRDRDKEPRLPNGKSQRLAIVKEAHQKSLDDVAEIRELARVLEEELEAQTEHVVSLESLRKAERIEELAREVGERMRKMR